MMPSSKRLSRQQITETLSNKGLKATFSSIGTLKYIPGNGSFSVVTGSKQQKKAVLRNKLRRQLYTLFSKYGFKKPISGILYASKQIYSLSYNDLKQNFYALLEKNTL